MRIWLKEIRKGLHMTQYSVADMVGIKRPYYSFIESGKRRPSPQVAQKIAQIMHFDWTRFFIDK
ncbi:MAG: helix-turn-helix transcriptional regulator [Lactobacillaceae bacterium]|nr:helix-turn-helix transcriptional regulator [Bombilactobacillus mellis]